VVPPPEGNLWVFRNWDRRKRTRLCFQYNFQGATAVAGTMDRATFRASGICWPMHKTKYLNSGPRQGQVLIPTIWVDFPAGANHWVQGDRFFRGTAYIGGDNRMSTTSGLFPVCRRGGTSLRA